MKAELESWQRPYTNGDFVYLEIADRSIFAEPYGPRYPKAVGRVFCPEPIQGGEYTAVNVSYVEAIEPWIFNRRVGDEMRILVEHEEVKDGKRHLRARILSTRDGSGRRDSGTELRIILFER